MIDEIRARLLACPIPTCAQADWDGTNHYEIQSPAPDHQEYWWLDNIGECLDSATDGGQRLGAVLWTMPAHTSAT